MIISSEAVEQGPSRPTHPDRWMSIATFNLSSNIASMYRVGSSHICPALSSGDMVPNPKPGTIDQVPALALPPIEPLNGMVTGSHTAKLAPAFAVATGLTVTLTTVVGPLQLLAVGVMV